MRKPSDSGGSGRGKTTACSSKVGLKRGPWTAEEDDVLSNYIKREGEGRWRTLPKLAGLLRCGKSCRLRWMNYLRPCVKRGQIAPDEEDLILRLHRLLGNRWSLIAGRIPGRTDNEIKNYWNTHLSKKLISQGIDPRTHKPLHFNNNTKNINQEIETPPQFQPAITFDPIPTLNATTTDPNDFTDDVFSSFLNSLINEDLYQNQQLPHYDASFSTPLAFGPAGWNAPLMSPAAAAAAHHHINPSDHHRRPESMTL